MRRGAIVFVAWGLWLGVWTAVQLLFLHATFPERTIQWMMLGSAAAGATATGVAVWQFSRARREEPTVALINDESAATATFAVGVAVALVGASFGLFLLLIGGGIAALGLGGLVREQIARARDRQRWRIR
jgi:hypothetical protein